MVDYVRLSTLTRSHLHDQYSATSARGYAIIASYLPQNKSEKKGPDRPPTDGCKLYQTFIQPDQQCNKKSTQKPVFDQSTILSNEPLSHYLYKSPYHFTVPFLLRYYENHFGRVSQRNILKNAQNLPYLIATTQLTHHLK